MKVTPSELPEVLRIELDEYRDDRGSFVETFNESRFEAAGIPGRFRQHNLSRSRKNALRGLHYQLHRPQGKLIQCIHGQVLDVAVDVRVGSPTFGRWVGVELSEAPATLLWIPPGFAHGFCAVSESAALHYLCTELYDPADDRGILWSDPDLGITWPLANPLLSERDRKLPTLAAARQQGLLPALAAMTAANVRA